MTDKKEIEKLKAKAKKSYLLYENMMEPYDCGSNMAEFINPTIKQVRLEYEEAMAKLRVMDPNHPSNI